MTASHVGTLALVLALLSLAGCGSDRAAAPVAAVPATEMADPARGRLLYEASCADCHTTETHWRARHLVSDWAQLVQEVTRWQSVAGQRWNRAEIHDVSAYLNRQFYDLPCPLPRCAAGTVGLAP